MNNKITKCVNVRVKNIRPNYNNLKEWMDDDDNVYIGRKEIVFIDGKRYPKKSSIWYNPFKINKNNSRTDVINKYKRYIVKKINDEILVGELLKLKNKNLGCRYHPNSCHGDVLIDLINFYS